MNIDNATLTFTLNCLEMDCALAIQPTSGFEVEGSQSLIPNQPSPDKVTMLKHAFCVFTGANLGVRPDYQKMATDIARLFHAQHWTMGQFVDPLVQRHRNY